MIIWAFHFASERECSPFGHMRAISPSSPLRVVPSIISYWEWWAVTHFFLHLHSFPLTTYWWAKCLREEGGNISQYFTINLSRAVHWEHIPSCCHPKYSLRWSSPRPHRRVANGQGQAVDLWLLQSHHLSPHMGKYQPYLMHYIHLFIFSIWVSLV